MLFPRLGLKKVATAGQQWRRIQVSGVRCQGTEVLIPDTLYETTNGLNSEPQNIEYRTAECRRVESLCSVFFKIDRIHYSMFDVGRSMFDVH